MKDDNSKHRFVVRQVRHFRASDEFAKYPKREATQADTKRKPAAIDLADAGDYFGAVAIVWVCWLLMLFLFL